ncbi:hypothetical protein KVT40_004865 [Elsinoe batatas]|uniref:Indole-diterpene biosynthesis protein PaxU n=1 Tax=Elsinoe batatas TaxID=2601811 RepID=A0A8K0L1I2_9PEZI|nr:hypothetical protein KVT40_004865 [Elsinoe batatas]
MSNKPLPSLPPPLHNYHALTPQIHHHVPSHFLIPATDPCLIYTSRYLDLYPHTPQLVLESTVADMLFASDTSQARAFTPAREVLTRAEGTGGLVFHVFSNGGAQTLGRLLVSMPRPQGWVMRALVLDSCPGDGTLRRSADAIMFSLPRAWVFVVFGGIVVYAICAVIRILDLVFGIPSVVRVSRRRLLDVELIGREVPRLYLYGKKDRMIWWEDVRRHAEHARQKGYVTVDEVLFEEGSHCAYVLKDGEEYWHAITSLIDGETLSR